MAQLESRVEESSAKNVAFDRSRWFTRGWTLQEFIAPSSVTFFDSRWKLVGTRAEMVQQLTVRTGIPADILDRSAPYSPIYLENCSMLHWHLDSFSVSARMLWAEDRETTRVEDRAYCLMGIFDVNMPLLYGEGVKAFQRLQELVLAQTNDQSILAFMPTMDTNHTAALAQRPGQFIPGLETHRHIMNKPMTISSGNIEADVLLCTLSKAQPVGPSNYSSFPKQYLAILQCNFEGSVLEPIGILLEAVSLEAKSFSRVIGLQVYGDAPSCYRLEDGADGHMWAVSIPVNLNLMQNYPHGVRFRIRSFENTRIAITSSPAVSKADMIPTRNLRQVTKFPLQISLSRRSDTFFFCGTNPFHCYYKVQDSYIRVDATGHAHLKAPRILSAPTIVPSRSGSWSVLWTGSISLGTSLHNEKNSNKENAEGLREREESDKTSDVEYSGSVLSAGRYILMWGV